MDNVKKTNRRVEQKNIKPDKKEVKNNGSEK